MKFKYISYLFIASITFSIYSCKEEVRYVNKIENQPKITDQNPKDNTILGIIENKDDNKISSWSKDENIAVFNMALGKKYKFTATNDGESADFTSQAILDKGDLITAFYPYNESDDIETFKTIAISNRYVQNKDNTEHRGNLNGEYMFASAIVGENNSAKLVFKPLTATLMIDITNKSADANFIIDSLQLKVSSPVFPENITIDNMGKITTFSDNKYSYINVDLNGQKLSENNKLESIIRLLPTTNGERSTIKGNEDVSLVLKARFENGEQKDFVIYKGKISDIPITGFSDSRNNFMSSEKYSISYDITYQDIPSEGYRIDEKNEKKYATIFNPQGLKALAKEINDNQNDEALKSCIINLYSKLSDKKFDMSNIDWEPIKEFNGVFNADGLVLENLNIKKSGTSAAFITKSSANISNLTIKNAKVETADNAAVFANEISGGVISNCVIDGATVTGLTGSVGGFAGKITGNSVITDCHLSNTTITSDKGAGGFACDVIGKADIKGCYTDETVLININDVSKTVGGLIGGYGSSKPLTACFSTANIDIKRGAGHIGGLIGQLVGDGKDITGCYAAGTITLEGAVNGCSVGGLLGTRWINKNWNLYKGVYSNTTLNPDAGNVVGNIQGKAQGPDGNQKGISTYYLQNNNYPAVGEHSVTTTQKITADELKNKLSEMNEFLKGTGYTFTTDGASDKEPLKIKKVQ